ncbi:hypothetical protein [Spiroplasma endosymbiont of Agriotes lineatus]|uniref:hypothetical protein n=1 Tax=Spiroplasma endosymbiont of Agriotes lineatus TaxID=3077930 RepID=UPI0030CBE10C
MRPYRVLIENINPITNAWIGGALPGAGTNIKNISKKIIKLSKNTNIEEEELTKLKENITEIGEIVKQQGNSLERKWTSAYGSNIIVNLGEFIKELGNIIVNIKNTFQQPVVQQPTNSINIDSIINILKENVIELGKSIQNDKDTNKLSSIESNILSEIKQAGKDIENIELDINNFEIFIEKIGNNMINISNSLNKVGSLTLFLLQIFPNYQKDLNYKE